MSTIPTFTSEPLPKVIDSQTVATLEKMFQDIQTTLTALKSAADDYEARITALEP